MNKMVEIIKKIWQFLNKYASGLLFAGVLLFGTMSVIGLRHNNQEMMRLRQYVYDEDKKGGDVEGALQDLRKYVVSHMNTSLSTENSVKPPIQLKYTYERLQAESQQQFSQSNGAMYNDAVRACAGQNVIGSDLIGCINKYFADHGVQIQDVPDALYKFDFVAARWSPDSAGLGMVGAVLCIIGMLLKGFINWLKRPRHQG